MIYRAVEVIERAKQYMIDPHESSGPLVTTAAGTVKSVHRAVLGWVQEVAKLKRMILATKRRDLFGFRHVVCPNK